MFNQLSRINLTIITFFEYDKCHTFISFSLINTPLLIELMTCINPISPLLNYMTYSSRTGVVMLVSSSLLLHYVVGSVLNTFALQSDPLAIKIASFASLPLFVHYVVGSVVLLFCDYRLNQPVLQSSSYSKMILFPMLIRFPPAYACQYALIFHLTFERMFGIFGLRMYVRGGAPCSTSTSFSACYFNFNLSSLLRHRQIVYSRASILRTITVSIVFLRNWRSIRWLSLCFMFQINRKQRRIVFAISFS